MNSQRTKDCDLFAHKNSLDTPHPRFELDSIIKVIDPVEHHSEWATFVIIGRQYNHERSALEYTTRVQREVSYSKRDLLDRNTESYLSEATASRINLSGFRTRRGFWYYWLINSSYEPTYDQRLWVAETEICLIDQSHLICIDEDIF